LTCQRKVRQLLRRNYLLSERRERTPFPSLQLARRSGSATDYLGNPLPTKQGTRASGSAQVRPQASAPGRIRTRDPLLRSHFRAVAGRRLMSPYVPSSCMNRPAVSPYVARHLSLVAPRLAPRNLVNLANVRMLENSVEYELLVSPGPRA
jgi:hypothetical protein